MTLAPGRRTDALFSGAVFVVVAIAYTLVGVHVSHVPPAGIDAAARSVAGESPRIAWIFTASCLWPTLTVFGIIGCVVAARVRAWRGRIVFAIVATLAAWQTSDELKNLFTRSRPTYWILHHETTYSYSSGHAMFATIVYWLWAYHAARSDAPLVVRAGLAGVLAAWGCGVIWSRLALGAHYPTDLAGGILLAIAMLALGVTTTRIAAPHVRVL